MNENDKQGAHWGADVPKEGVADLDRPPVSQIVPDALTPGPQPVVPPPLPVVAPGERGAGEQGRQRNPFKRMLLRVTNSGKAMRVIHAAKPAHPVNITWQDIERQFVKQKGRCYWLGVKLNADDAFKVKDILCPSIDRLNIRLGYEVGNFVICARLANLGRGPMEPHRFAEQITKLRKMIANEMWPKYLFDDLPPLVTESKPE